MVLGEDVKPGQARADNRVALEAAGVAVLGGQLAFPPLHSLLQLEEFRAALYSSLGQEALLLVWRGMLKGPDCQPSAIPPGHSPL